MSEYGIYSSKYSIELDGDKSQRVGLCLGISRVGGVSRFLLFFCLHSTSISLLPV